MLETDVRLEKLHLHNPNIFWKILESLRLRDVKPGDICPPNELESLFLLYPDLWGDTRSFDENSESWRGYSGWYKNLIPK